MIITAYVLAAGEQTTLLGALLLFAGTVITAAFGAWQAIKAKNTAAGIESVKNDQSGFSLFRDTWIEERKGLRSDLDEARKTLAEERAHRVQLERDLEDERLECRRIHINLAETIDELRKELQEVKRGQ